MTTPIDRQIIERKLIMDFIHWLDENKPAPLPYEYMFTVHNRLSMTPELALYIIPKHAKSSVEALGGVSIAMPSEWDLLDGIRHLWNEVKHHDTDLRDYIPKENPGH